MAESPNNAPGQPMDAEALLPHVYSSLKALARRKMGQERDGHTLTATALVHEAYLRLVGDNARKGFAGRASFFHAAAEAMRRILIDHARAAGRSKRGGRARKRLPLSVVDLAVEPEFEQVVALDDAICRLNEESPDVAAVVRLRFYAGLGVDETAEALGISPRSVNRAWTYARAWLHAALDGDAS